MWGNSVPSSSRGLGRESALAVVAPNPWKFANIHLIEFRILLENSFLSQNCLDDIWQDSPVLFLF